MTPPLLHYEILNDAEKEGYLTRLEDAWEAAGTADGARSRAMHFPSNAFLLLIFGIVATPLSKQLLFRLFAAGLAISLLRWVFTESAYLIYKRRTRAYLKTLQKKYRCSGVDILTFPGYPPAVGDAKTTLAPKDPGGGRCTLSPGQLRELGRS